MSKTALVVDDSKSARFALRKYLENHGYQVEALDGAAAAYDYLKSQLPDIIFLDHIMPGIDGFEALQHIKREPRTSAIAIVICSSNEGPSFNDEARSKGAATVLQKPPSPEQLQRVLENVQASLAKAAPVAAPAAPKPAGIPPATPAKVTNIREPEVAIEQAVMKALRSAIPPRHEPAPVPATPDLSATGRFSMGSTGQLREQIDERIRKVTQDLFVQVASLRADLNQVEDRPGGADEPMREEVAALRTGLEALENSFSMQLNELQARMEAGFEVQTQRLEQLAQSARQAAAEEAHKVSERVVMAAAARISDQLADSILKAFRTPQQQRSEAK